MSSSITENIIPSGLYMFASAIEDAGEKSMISRWRKEYDLYMVKRRRRSAILRAVADGYDTLREIVAETGVPQTTCHRILRKLEKEKRIISRLVETDKEVTVSGTSVKISPYKERRFALFL